MECYFLFFLIHYLSLFVLFLYEIKGDHDPVVQGNVRILHNACGKGSPAAFFGKGTDHLCVIVCPDPDAACLEAAEVSFAPFSSPYIEPVGIHSGMGGCDNDGIGLQLLYQVRGLFIGKGRICYFSFFPSPDLRKDDGRMGDHTCTDNAHRKYLLCCREKMLYRVCSCIYYTAGCAPGKLSDIQSGYPGGGITGSGIRTCFPSLLIYTFSRHMIKFLYDIYGNGRLTYAENYIYGSRLHSICQERSGRLHDDPGS